jgi:transposase
MGQKELLISKVLEMVKQGKMSLKAGAIMLKVSYRQGIRLYAAYRKEGDAGLIHGNCGKRSNNRTAEAIREAAVMAYRER